MCIITSNPSHSMIPTARSFSDTITIPSRRKTVPRTYRKSIAISQRISSLLHCSDIRNTKISALVNALQCYKINVSIVDPVASALDVKQEYNLDIYREIPTSFKYDALLVAVAHDQFKSHDPVFWRNLLSDKGLIFDLKGMLPDHLATWRP